MKTENQKDGEEAADHLSIAASGKGQELQQEYSEERVGGEE